MRSTRMPSSSAVMLAVVVGVFFTAEEVFMDLAGQRPQLAGRDVVNGAVFWVVWVALAPIAYAAVRRWSLDVRPVGPRLAANAMAAIALSALHNVLSYGLELAINDPELSAAQMLRRATSGTAFVWGLFTGVVFYSVILMVYTAQQFRKLYVAEQLGTAALKQELTQTKLDTLRSQLQPHFLFNTLNAISVFVKEDADLAQQMILRLSTLLRRSLDESAHEIPLERELAFVTDYLDIQRGRFGDRLVVDLSVEPAVLGARVPVFLLQPMLENAIEHGKSDDRCAVALRIARDGDMLDITLVDNGPGMPAAHGGRERVGVGNTRQRLLQLYGARASIELGYTPNGAAAGGRVHIRIPFEQAIA
jgi:signal transduction histidine kinase